MELCYRNNSKSLFRKYVRLLSSLTKHQLFRDYLTDVFPIPKESVILLPNGYIRSKGEKRQLVITTRAVYAQKLYTALAAFDSVAMWVKDWEEAQRFLAWQLGLSDHIPALAKIVHLSQIIVNPNASPESTSTDGYVERASVDETFGTIRAGAGTGSNHVDATDIRCPGYVTNSTSTHYSQLRRSILLFDTSVLGLGTVIQNTSKYSMYFIATQAQNLGADSVSLVGSSPASNTTLANADYGQTQTTLFAPTSANFNTITINQYTDFILNATGIAAITLNGITKFANVSELDRSNGTPTWSSTASNEIAATFADSASNKPKLTIDYGGSPDDYCYFL